MFRYDNIKNSVFSCFIFDRRETQTTKNTMHINTLNNIHNALCFIVLLIQWISIIIMSGPGSQLLFYFFVYFYNYAK